MRLNRWRSGNDLTSCGRISFPTNSAYLRPCRQISFPTNSAYLRPCRHKCSAREPSGFKTVVTPNKKGDNPQGYALGYCRDLLGASMHLALRASTCGAVRCCSCSTREPSGFMTVVTPNKKGDNPQGYLLFYIGAVAGT